jgi:hypothetical protein
MADQAFATKKVSRQLLDEIITSMQSVRGWGSIEIFIQNYTVTQITEKNIKKPNAIIGTKS